MTTDSDPAAAAATTANPVARSLGDLVSAASAAYGDRTAFTTCLPNGMHGSLTFADVDRLSDAFAAYLREDLRLAPGDRVAVMLPNSLGYPVVAFGILKAGCVLVNTNPLYTAPEMQRQFADAEIAALVAVDMFADRVAQVLAAVGSPPVVLASVSEFMPGYVQRLVRIVQRYWNRVLPRPTFEHVRLAQALERGAGHRTDHSVDVAGYRADVGPDTLAALQYTGGTTGVSKGAMLTHGNLLANCDQMLAMAGDGIRHGRETVLTALPLYHVFAFTVNLLGFYRAGGHNVLVPNPRPLANLRRALENYPITWITGVDTLFHGLTREQWFLDHPPPHLRAAAAGGMALHHATARRWEEVTGTPAVEGYGLTEAGPVISFNPLVPGPDGAANRPGTVGRPVPRTAVRCVRDDGTDAPVGEPGEVWARGPQVMAGYWRRPEETAQVLRDGWLRTGDVGVVDADGYLRIVDRIKDVILVSGFNVFPGEVEDALAEHPGVREVAVVGVPGGPSGELVRAVVALDDPAVTPEQLRAFAAERLTNYKVPKDIVITDELPKSPIGKILRKDVRARHGGAPSPTGGSAAPADTPLTGQVRR